MIDRDELRRIEIEIGRSVVARKLLNEVRRLQATIAVKERQQRLTEQELLDCIVSLEAISGYTPCVEDIVFSSGSSEAVAIAFPVLKNLQEIANKALLKEYFKDES